MSNITDLFPSLTGGGGVSSHTELTNRDAANQHPIRSITGLDAQLNGKVSSVQAGVNVAVDNTDPQNPVISLNYSPPATNNPRELTLDIFQTGSSTSLDKIPVETVTDMQLIVGANISISVPSLVAGVHLATITTIQSTGGGLLRNVVFQPPLAISNGLYPAVDYTLTNLDIPLDGAVAHGDLAGRNAANQHPISSITDLQSTLDGKQATLVSGTNIKTINGISVLGGGNIEVSGGGTAVPQKNYFNTRKSLKVELTRLSGLGFPNGFFIDEPNNDIYVGYARGSAPNTTFARYNFTTGELIQSFTAGASNFPEGFAVLTVGGVKQLITRTTSDSYGAIGKYDITTVSVSGGNAPLITASPDIGAYYQMSFDGKWLYVESGINVGVITDRSAISIYDLDFNYVGQFTLNGSLLGDNDRPDLPKRQSFTVQNGYVIAGLGGAVATGTGDSTRRYQGVAVMTTAGDVVNTMLSPHDSWLPVLNSLQGTTFTGTYSENEGVCAVPSGDVYSLWVTGSAGNKSIKIVKEFSADSSSTDFTSVIKTLPFLHSPDVYYPNRNRDTTMRKVLGSGQISTLRDIFTEMGQLNCRSFQFFSNHFTLSLGLPSSPNLNNAFIRVTNADNANGYVEVLAPTYTKTYYVTNTLTGTISVTEVP